MPVPTDDEIHLYGLDDNLSVDVTQIAQDELLSALKRLPEGNVVELLKQLPEGIMNKVCTAGVNEKLSVYIIPALSGLGVGIVVGFATDSYLYGGLAAVIIGGLVYYM